MQKMSVPRLILQKPVCSYYVTWDQLLSPMNAFQFVLGLETLHVRMKEHVANAVKVADYLEKHPAVSWVLYPGRKIIRIKN